MRWYCDSRFGGREAPADRVEWMEGPGARG